MQASLRSSSDYQQQQHYSYDYLSVSSTHPPEVSSQAAISAALSCSASRQNLQQQHYASQHEYQPHQDHHQHPAACDDASHPISSNYQPIVLGSSAMDSIYEQRRPYVEVASPPDDSGQQVAASILQEQLIIHNQIPYLTSQIPQEETHHHHDQQQQHHHNHLLPQADSNCEDEATICSGNNTSNELDSNGKSFYQLPGGNYQAVYYEPIRYASGGDNNMEPPRVEQTPFAFSQDHLQHQHYQNHHHMQTTRGDIVSYFDISGHYQPPRSAMDSGPAEPNTNNETATNTSRQHQQTQQHVTGSSSPVNSSDDRIQSHLYYRADLELNNRIYQPLAIAASSLKPVQESESKDQIPDPEQNQVAEHQAIVAGEKSLLFSESYHHQNYYDNQHQLNSRERKSTGASVSQSLNESSYSSAGSSSSASSSSSSSSDESSASSSLTRDELRAKEANIPLSYCEIVNLSIDQFNEQLSRYQLTESQLSLIKDIRRRGKNKVAAQSCRKRKMEQIHELQHEVKHLADKRRSLGSERKRLIQEHENLVQEYNKINAIIQLQLQPPQLQQQQ